MGDAVPQTPWDLSLSFSGMDVFFFTANGTCRTMERLDRRTGLRRDATRAPIQARNGWRPHGRCLGQPATPSKDGRNFVQTMGSTSEEQVRGIGQITTAIAQMNHVTQSVAAQAEESASAAEELNAQSEALKQIVQHLTVMVAGGESHA